MTETQQRVAKVWAAVLPSRTARMFVPESNFFEEGGHSILAQQMLFKVRREWKDIDVPMSAIFQSQTLGEFAAEIDRALDPTGLRLDVAPFTGYGSTQDEAYAADARDLAKKLPESIPAAAQTDGPATVLLTGATGFLGSYILRELLERNHRVIAHVRAKDAPAGLERIETISKAYGIWSDDFASRLSVVTGDIAKPNLGLGESDWARLADEVDVVIHNGAQVNWMLPYSSMRAANTLSTADCVALASKGKAKKLAFVSSTSTLDTDHYVQLAKESVAAGGTGVQEDDDMEGSRKGLGTGYGQSKWASEYLVREAGRRGLAGTVVRPGYVAGDPVRGNSITDDFLVRFWKGCLQLGARPDIENSLNQVPVTEVARVVVASALHPPVSPLGVAQVTSHPRLTLNSWLGALEEYGYTVPKVSYAEWTEKLRAYVDEDKEEHALLPLFHHVAGDLPSNAVAPELDDSNAEKALEALGEGGKEGLRCVSIESMGVYIAYLVATGFLSAPEGKGAREVPSLVLGEEKLAALARIGGRGGK
ncbi:thioester reductase domain-containing protein [Candidatus Bathyarchaeota archaeon]|nr:thioester reductase domain-containing protein [Candidatus Bathyarchaeota archaeon]